MNGIKYLLDTNFILGLLKATPEVLATVTDRDLSASSCAYSAVTRMELLGYPNISSDEELLINDRLSKFTYLPISSEVENLAINAAPHAQIEAARCLDCSDCNSPRPRIAHP